MRRRKPIAPNLSEESSDDDTPLSKRTPPKRLKASTSREDSSSSESDIENYLQPIDKIDLNSTFFTTTNSAPHKNENNDTQKPEMTENNTVKENHDCTSYYNFNQLTDFTKRIEETKKVVAEYNAKRIKSDASELDISNLLNAGETKLSEDKAKVLKEIHDSLNSSDFESCSDSDDNENWQEVKAKDNENDQSADKSGIPNKAIEITVEMPGALKKKKGVDLLTAIKRRFNRIKKENQILIHKVHLLCWIAYGNHVNKNINSQEILSLALSLLPSEKSYPSERTDLNYLEQILKWYRKTVVNLEKPAPKTTSLDKLLEQQIKKKETYNKKMFVFIFIAILRSLGIQCRLVLSFQVQPLRPPASELYSLSNKNVDENKLNKSKIGLNTSKLKTSKAKTNNTKSLKNEGKASASSKSAEASVKKENAKSKKLKSVKIEEEPSTSNCTNKTIKTKTETDSTTEKAKFSPLSKEDIKIKFSQKSKSLPKAVESNDKDNVPKSRSLRSVSNEKNSSKKPKTAQSIVKEKTPNTEKSKAESGGRSRKKLRSTATADEQKICNAEESNSAVKVTRSAEKLKATKETTKKSPNSGKTKDSSKVKNSAEVSNEKTPTAEKSKPVKKTTPKGTKPKKEIIKIKLPTRKAKTVPQVDGNCDSDDDIKTENTKLKPKLHKIKEVNKLACPIRTNPRRSTKLKITKYRDTDSEDEFRPRSPFTKKNTDSPKLQGVNLKKLKSPPSSKPSTSKSCDIRDDIIDIVRTSIKTQKDLNATKLVKKRKALNHESDDSDFVYEPSVSKKNDDFKPKVKQRVQVKKTKVLSSDSEDDSGIKKRKGNDVWIEVFLETEEKWISVDVIKGQVHCVNELYNRATHPVSYVVAWNNDNTLKDITRRYCINFNTVTRKLRVDSDWWKASLKPFEGVPNARDREEDDELERQQREKPLPTSIAEYKNHPLYVLKRHLLKFEAIYPPDAPTLGFVRNEPVYSRQCVYTLHSRDIWLKHAKVVKLGEKPYKIVKARPKYDKLSNTVITDQLLEVFGPWQTEDYVPPTAENGVVPRNAYGNVELFKMCMLPKKTVHLQLPGLNKIAKRMNIDCAPAVVGFDFHSGWSHPTFDGFVVCEEFADTLVAAWELEQEEMEKKEQEKIEKRVYGNWKKLIKGLLIRERLKNKYDFGEASSSGTKKIKGPKLCTKKRKICSDSESE